VISHRSYQVFGNKDGQVVHISDVSRGLSCSCVCPHCISPLIAKKGSKNIHHFAHVASDADCGYGDQTALHLLAKEILLNEKNLVLPQLHVSAVAFDVNGNEHNASKTIPPYRLLIDQIEDEVVLDGIVPDIIIRSGAKELLVEIAVTNFVNDRKRNWLEQRDKASIQIDLSKYYQSGDWDFDKIRHIIVESVVEKTWVFNPKKIALYKILLAQAQSEADKIKQVNPIVTAPSHLALTSPRKQVEQQPQGKIVMKHGFCQRCNEFIAKEMDWGVFYTSTMTCICNKCLRSVTANIDNV